MAFPFQLLLETVLPYLLMGKDKKKHSKKDKDQVSEGILDVAHLSVRKFRKVTKEIGKLSTGQKLVGGVALLAAGLTYLANRPAAPAAPASGKLPALTNDSQETNDEQDSDELAAEVGEAPRKPQKPRKSK